MIGNLTIPPTADGEEIEDWALRIWFAAWRQLHSRDRELYPEWVDIGGEA